MTIAGYSISKAEAKALKRDVEVHEYLDDAKPASKKARRNAAKRAAAKRAA
jgi:hypothetical protein